jgi:hypothetical protein
MGWCHGDCDFASKQQGMGHTFPMTKEIERSYYTEDNTHKACTLILGWGELCCANRQMIWKISSTKLDGGDGSGVVRADLDV